MFGGIHLHGLYELYSLSLMAFAVGMDAFSVSLGIGMNRLRLRRIFQLGLTVGLFHILMPLAGSIFGKFLSEHLGVLAVYSGGILLVFIGIQMVLSSFKQEKTSHIPHGLGVLFFALSVSLDSFTLGLTLGIFEAKMVTALVLFGLFATGLSWLGLLLGRKMQRFFGNYSEALGGSILFFFGLKLLFS